MEKTTILLAVLFGVLLLAQVMRVESFTDASDNSGNRITLSVSDLLALVGSGLGSSGSTSTTPTTNPVIVQAPGGLDATFYNSIKSDLLSDVKETVRSELLNNPLATSAGSVLDDGCIDNFAAQQGTDWMKYVPGKNPNDYIRKDSIPCYGCTVPT
jgi:hypothetical protein